MILRQLWHLVGAPPLVSLGGAEELNPAAHGAGLVPVLQAPQVEDDESSGCGHYSRGCMVTSRPRESVWGQFESQGCLCFFRTQLVSDGRGYARPLVCLLVEASSKDTSYGADRNGHGSMNPCPTYDRTALLPGACGPRLHGGMRRSGFEPDLAPYTGAYYRWYRKRCTTKQVGVASLHLANFQIPSACVKKPRGLTRGLFRKSDPWEDWRFGMKPATVLGHSWLIP